MVVIRSASDLNPAQRAAVEHLHGPVLVIAGAGTGKTRVISERIAHLLRAIPELSGENILAITYTKKAAAEMAARIRRAAGKRADGIGVFTFHAFCYDLLRRHHEALKILEPVDYWIFLRRRLDRLGLDLFLRLSEPGRFLSDFDKFFSRCQDELVSPEDYRAYVERLCAQLDSERALLGEEERAEREQELARQRELARAYAAAEQLLREADRTTFGGSLLSAVALLRARADLREYYQDRYRYILVDEFQDANIAQIELLSLLAGRHRNVMAVGDDDQAIYRFRGASYASFRKFAQLFPDRREITLNENYRSTARILRVATTLIAQNGLGRYKPDKRLLPLHPPGERVHLAELDDPAAEAAFVVAQIERLRKEAGSCGGIAVLYRAHLHRDALVTALRRAGIAFVIRGLSVLTHPLVRDLIAWFRAVENPRDNISLARLLALPEWGLSLENLLELLERAHHEKCSILQAVESLHPRVRDQQTRLGAFLALLSELRGLAPRLPLTEFVERLLERINFRLLPADPDRPAFEAFVRFLRQWEAEKSETKRLAEFVEYFGYFEEANGSVNLYGDDDKAAPPEDAVQLMTVHSAKGLEFNSVFLLRLNRNDFPTRRRRPLFEFPEALMNEPLPPGDFHVQEERRLCYVALTRARRRLALSTLCGERRAPSVFLEDILRDPHAARDVEQLTPAAVAADPPPSVRAAVPETMFAAESAARASRIGAWARQDTESQESEPLSLSHTALETFQKCPLKYKFSDLWRLPGASTPAMVFGQIMHRSVVEYFRARRQNPALNREELEHIYEQQWRQAAWPSADDFQRQRYHRSGWEQLQKFLAQQAGSAANVLELEKTFTWPWEDVVLTGRIDQINRLEARNVEIIEYKTGQPRPEKTVQKSLQLALYALAAERQLNLRPARLTLYNFTAGEGVSFAPDDKQAARALDTVREVADRIRAREFPPRPGFHCRYCDYRPLCPAFEQSSAAAEDAGREENEE
ncbi:MAG: ATP-dependent helicase [Candidatus Acidiferrales bacterium]